ncbi:Oidioi.mRNA.OKI2018_I69.chr2.g4775.t1.cds [Oikopleura dioica]|uniref:Oidioi.mRNA.OKI2018_I69.chr2.g4775.t1.cds n=1 Tax=Oikopleura dioica TaxID=34765 RepID=A0ABN7T4W4_OIKDI|nr:Oidioi.mRNA.OKI2018_I69.chr2.g4775.t1.cds [Oikopleura dioica]
MKFAFLFALISSLHANFIEKFLQEKENSKMNPTKGENLRSYMMKPGASNFLDSYLKNLKKTTLFQNVLLGKTQ